MGCSEINRWGRRIVFVEQRAQVNFYRPSRDAATRRLIVAVRQGGQKALSAHIATLHDLIPSLRAVSFFSSCGEGYRCPSIQPWSNGLSSLCLSYFSALSGLLNLFPVSIGDIQHSLCTSLFALPLSLQPRMFKQLSSCCSFLWHPSQHLPCKVDEQSLVFACQRW